MLYLSTFFFARHYLNQIERRTPEWEPYYDAHWRALLMDYERIPQLKEELEQLDARKERCRAQLRAGVGTEPIHCAECAVYSTLSSVDSTSTGRFYFMLHAPLIIRLRTYPITAYALRILQLRYSGSFDVNAPIVRDVRVPLRKRSVPEWIGLSKSSIG